jgi:transcriptional regulator with XRE-family HTH domain
LTLTVMEIAEEKITFGALLREKRIARGWSQYYLASRAGCTNSNISYLESHPNQRPRIDTVEALAAALDWPVNEARRLAGHPESEFNVSRIEVEDEFRFALYGYKQLSPRGRDLVKRQIGIIIDFVSECEQDTSENDPAAAFERQTANNAPDRGVPEMTLDELDRRIMGREKTESRDD